MGTSLIIMYLLLKHAHANVVNEFIVDYFRYKEAPTVVGYSYDAILIRNFNKNGINVALHRFESEFKVHVLGAGYYGKVGIFIDVRCHNVSNIVSIFLDAAKYQMYGELHNWLILGYNLADIIKIIYDDSFGSSTDFVIAVSSANRNNYELYDVFNFSKLRGAVLNVTFLGYWERNKKINIILRQSKFSRRMDLHGLILKAGCLPILYKPPSMTVEEYYQEYVYVPHVQTEGLTKFGFNLLKHMSDLYNFRLKIHQLPKWEKGDQIGPVIRALRTNEADFSGTPLVMTIARTYLARFVHQDWPIRTCFIFRNPQPTDIKFAEIFRPFSDNAWYLMAVMIILNIIIFTIITRHDYDELPIMRLFNSIIVMTGALSQQGSEMPMIYISTRIAFLSIMIFSLLIYNYYGAGVVSARINEPIIKINDSLNEMTKLHLKLYSEYFFYIEFFMKWNKNPFYYNTWLKIPEKDRYLEPETAMALVRKGGYAYHAHPEVAYPFVDRTYDEREICELMEVHVVRPTKSCFVIRENSSFDELSRNGLTKITEVGLRKRQLYLWQYPTSRCNPDALSASSVNIYEFLPQLILLFIGFFIAGLIFYTECIVAYYMSRNS